MDIGLQDLQKVWLVVQKFEQQDLRVNLAEEDVSWNCEEVEKTLERNKFRNCLESQLFPLME
jgi:hypothetical protein